MPPSSFRRRVALLLTLVLGGCSNEFAWSVSNGFKAIQLCLDDGGLKRMIDNRESGFVAECKDGRIVEGRTAPSSGSAP
ncbi:MAG: hypothetical protein AB7U30_11200 [Sulfuricellaceae bacterium]|jgi:hypothetical protein